MTIKDFLWFEKRLEDFGELDSFLGGWLTIPLLIKIKEKSGIKYLTRQRKFGFKNVKGEFLVKNH